MKEIVQSIKEAEFVFVCGNGGSSTTAEHFTNDLFSKGVKAICLNSNTSIMTMIANDFGYNYVFSRQLKVLANKKEDLLIAFSVSGRSKNIKEAMSMGIKTIGIFGDKTETPQQAEDRHLRVAHKVAQLI